MRILVLFFPWVNDARDASANVPFVEKLWVDGARSWREALCMHVQRHGFPTEDQGNKETLHANAARCQEIFHRVCGLDFNIISYC